MESVLIDEADTVTKRRPRTSRKVKGATSTDIGTATAGLFAMVAMARGDHWFKSVEECTAAVGEPLAQLLENSSPELAKKVGNAMLPISLAVGIVALCANPIRIEMERRKLANESNERNRQTSTGYGQYYNGNGRTNGVEPSSTNGNGQQRDNVGGTNPNPDVPIPFTSSLG